MVPRDTKTRSEEYLGITPPPGLQQHGQQEG